MLVIVGAILCIVGWQRFLSPAVRSQGASRAQLRLVTVEEDVRLEVIDWGGSGRPLVLLAGSGNTAHVFDDFAPKLAESGHVYGITRRGYGASSHPPSDYDDQRLADDVLTVLDTLAIDRPVLVGHSMAGGELTTLGSQHSNRLSGLVYLDALGDPRDVPAGDPAYMALYQALPAPMRNPPSADYSSFSAYRTAQRRNGQAVFPESELRQLFAAKADGSMGPYKASSGTIHNAIGVGQKRRDYSRIQVPVLAFSDFMLQPDSSSQRGTYQPQNDEERAAVRAVSAATKAYVDRWAAHLKRDVPEARLLDLPGSDHFVFLSHESDVLGEIRRFVAAVD